MTHQISLYAMPGVSKLTLSELFLTTRKSSKKERKINNATIIKKLMDKYYGFDVGFRSRKIAYTDARFMSYTMMKEFTNVSLETIGIIVGGKKPYDHASVSHGLKEMSNLRDTDESQRREYDKIKSYINGELQFIN